MHIFQKIKGKVKVNGQWSMVNGREAFTFIETLIYTMIFATMIGFLVFILYQVVDGQQQIKNRSDAETEAHFLMQKIAWGLAGTQMVNQPASGATSTTLSINKFNFSQNPLVFDLSSGTLRLARGTSSAIVLSSSNVTVSNLTFQHLAAVGNQPEGVRVTFSVQANFVQGTRRASTSLDTTIYVRQ